MSKSIAIWGNSGSGKSLLSCALGNALTAKGKNVIILNTDKLSPMLEVYLPFLENKKEHSLGVLLSSSILADKLVNKIHIHKDNKNLGFMGLSANENSLVYQTNWITDYIHQLVMLLMEEGFADYIIFDCTPDIFADNMTLYALEKSSHVIRVLSPDNRGIAFWETQQLILRGGNFHAEKHITVLNNAYSYSPVAQIRKDYGFEYVLPHCKDAYNNFTGGKLIKGLWGKDGERFGRTIKQLAESVRENE